MQTREERDFRDDCRSRTSFLIEIGRIKRVSICQSKGCRSKKNVEVHHLDYTNPRKINWICASCHAQLHWDSLSSRDKAERGICISVKAQRRIKRRLSLKRLNCV